MKPFAIALLLLLTGCATHASLTVFSQPEGAYITEVGTGLAFGIAPTVIAYDAKRLPQHRDPSGCYLVRGLEAHWVSGVATKLNAIRLCRGVTGEYNITLSRDPAIAGLEKDLQFALQLQTLRAQQQQAQAAQNAAAAALFSSWQSTQPVNCTSTTIGNQVQTNCR